ncbi:MAG: GNAT family N-acetyltransferase [Hyphomicrobiaceae bacterium]
MIDVGWEADHVIRAQKFTRSDRIIAYTLKKLEKIGLKLDLVMAVREAQTPITIADVDTSIAFAVMGEPEVEDVLETQPYRPNDALQRIRDGRLMFFAGKRGSQLVAGMWCDLDEFFSWAPPRKLSDDEVFLFGAYVIPECRGQNVAPVLRSRCYSALKEMGRTKIYSCTDIWNAPARKFKSKLHSRNEALFMTIDFFGLWKRSFTLRTYA